MITTAQLLKTVQSALELKRDVTIEDSVDTLKGWDSVGHLAILVAVDRALDGKASEIKGLVQCQSVKSLCQVLRENRLLKD